MFAPRHVVDLTYAYMLTLIEVTDNWSDPIDTKDYIACRSTYYPGLMIVTYTRLMVGLGDLDSRSSTTPPFS